MHTEARIVCVVIERHKQLFNLSTLEMIKIPLFYGLFLTFIFRMKQRIVSKQTGEDDKHYTSIK